MTTTTATAPTPAAGNGAGSLLVSPNSVLANALLRSIDVLRPRIHAARPARIEFVGTQINSAPHLGTNLVQTAAFLLAKIARREFSIDTRVRFGALDNAPHEVVLDPETHTAYQQTYHHALGSDQISELIGTYYREFFISLSEATGTDYLVETYTKQQAGPGFRAEFLRSLERLEEIRWWMAPSHGVVHVRLPCPDCGWAEKRGDRTRLARLDEDGAVFTAVCLDHGRYEVHVDPEDPHPYLDLATLYRNLVKECALGRDTDTLHVMMKGGDWAFGCQLFDGALSAPSHVPEGDPMDTVAWTLSIIRGDAGPGANGDELGCSALEGVDLGQETWGWLEAHGCDAPGDDLTWVLVTPAGQHPGELANLVAQRELELPADTAGLSQAYAAAWEGYAGSPESGTD